jgi:type I restriction enzyme S subunit
MKKAYPKYSRTNIPWLPRVPMDWQQVPINAITQPKSIKGRDDLPLLSVYRDFGVILKDSRDDNHNRAGEDLTSYKIVKPGNLVLNKMKTWQGSLGISSYEGLVSPAYIVCDVSKEVHGKFLHYLLRSNNYIYEYNRLSYGIRNDQWDMRYEDFKRIPIFLPSLPEQRQIAAFLDHKCALIDTFIQKKTRLIELLKEQKQAIINKAVTKGIDPNVRLKPSGIDWLGDIPEHWEVKKLKYVANLKSGSNLTSEVIQEEGLYPVYGGNGLRGYYPKFTHEGDYVLIGRQGALCGNINYANGKFWTTEHAWVVTIKNGAHRFWLGELLRAMNLNQYSQSAAQPGLSIDNIKNLPMPIPSIRDQKRIEEYLEKEFEKIAKTISQIEKELTLLQEYKTTLIAEAVTGKIDVREWKPKQVAEEVEQPINQVQAYGSN